jgi:hypothetical protein
MRRRANPLLAGRGSERASLDRLLAAARQEQSAVLVVRGEAGIGKSALLAYAAERAEGCRVCRAVGAEWEMELPFAGVHQLCVWGCWTVATECPHRNVTRWRSRSD